MEFTAKLKALAHPARLAILRTLADRGNCVCGEVVEAMPLAQATISQHLKILKDSGLIQGRIDGRNSCYCLDPDAIATLHGALDRLLDDLAAGARRVAEPKEVTP